MEKELENLLTFYKIKRTYPGIFSCCPTRFPSYNTQPFKIFPFVSSFIRQRNETYIFLIHGYYFNWYNFRLEAIYPGIQQRHRILVETTLNSLPIKIIDAHLLASKHKVACTKDNSCTPTM